MVGFTADVEGVWANSKKIPVVQVLSLKWEFVTPSMENVS